MGSKITWTEETWNPIIGCTPVSEGCDHCYAKRMAAQLSRYNPLYRRWSEGGLATESLSQGRLASFAKPRTIFVSSMGDLFHPNTSLELLMEVFRIMGEYRKHTFMVLTKRVESMENFVVDRLFREMDWPDSFPHVWLGVTAENQYRAEERIPMLVGDIPAAHHFVSLEPLLGPMDVGPWIDDLDLVIVGGENGLYRRPMDEQWARSIRDECREAGVPFHYKGCGAERQPGKVELDGEVHHEMPPFDREADRQMDLLGSTE